MVLPSRKSNLEKAISGEGDRSRCGRQLSVLVLCSQQQDCFGIPIIIRYSGAVLNYQTHAG